MHFGKRVLFGTILAADLARSGSIWMSKRCIFDRFGGLMAVQTRNARPLRNTGRAQSNQGSGVPRATQNHAKITPEACFERLSAKTKRRRRLASSCVLFFNSPGRPGDALRRSGSVPGTSRGRPGASRERPGTSRKTPESPKVAPAAPESDFALI